METGSKRAAPFDILGQPVQRQHFLSQEHTAELSDNQFYIHTHAKDNFGSKFVPNLSFLLKQVLTGPNYHHSCTAGKSGTQSKNFSIPRPIKRKGVTRTLQSFPFNLKDRLFFFQIKQYLLARRLS